VGSEQDSEDGLRLGNDTTNQYYFNLTASLNQQDNKEFFIYLGKSKMFLENLEMKEILNSKTTLIN